MTSSWESQKPHNRTLTSIKYQDSLIHAKYDLILSEIQLIRNSAVKFYF